MADIETPVTVGSLVPLAEGQDAKSSLDQVELTVKRAKEYLKTIEGTAKKAADADGKLAEHVAKAAEAQARADNEALRASQAKGFVEEHSNAAAKLKGSMEIDAAAIAQKRAEIETISQGFANLRSTSESNATAIVSSRKTADEAAKSITETSGTAAAVQANISQVKKDIEALAQAVREQSKTITADVSQVTTAKETSAVLLATIQKTTTASSELQERSKTAYASIESLEKSAKAKTETVSELVNKSLELQKKVADYENNLAVLTVEFKTMTDKVERLLPGATSAGLASSFADQRKHFAGEREQWAKILVGSLGLLMLVVIVVGVKLPPGADDWGGIARHLLERLPYMVPPFWLAVYAGRQHMLATQMEEEYATKAAVSTSFEGYKREMASDPEAAKALCNDVLAIIARRPGLVYEGKQEDVTAFTPAVEATKKLMLTAVDAVAAKLKLG